MDAYAYGFTTENSHYGATRNPHDLSRIAGGSFRRFGRGGGGRTGPFQPRQRHQRLDSRPRVAVRDLWSETHLRSPVTLRQPSVCRQSGSYWSLCPGATSPRCMTPCRGATRPMTFRPIKPASAPATCWSAVWRFCAARGWGAISPPGAMTTPGRPWIARPRAGRRQRAAVRGCRAGPLGGFIISASEGGNQYLTDLRHSPERFEPHSRERLLAGAMIPSAWYLQAQRFRRHARQAMKSLFSQADVLIAPATRMQRHANRRGGDGD